MKQTFNCVIINDEPARQAEYNFSLLITQYLRCVAFLLIVSHTAYSQQVTLTGSFYDATNAYDLPVKVYSVKTGSGKIQGETHKDGIYNTFKIQLQKGMDSLLFESAGHHPKKFPLHFHGNFRHDVQDAIDIETLKLDKPEVNRSYVIFAKPENAKNHYNVIHYRGDELHCKREKVVRGTYGVLEQELHDNNSRYVVQVLSSEDAVISEVEYRILPGINIVDMNTYPQAATHETIADTQPFIENVTINEDKAIPDSKEPVAEPHEFEQLGIPAIYFEQSKYELTETAQKLLAEVLVYLKQKPSQRLQIKGYTDGVGNKSLNEALARYRARVVAHYLINNGVPENNVDLEWENSESKNTGATTELDAYRKTTITEIK